ncbi:RICIN domain-containing protein [Streptomyces sp. SID13666]|uniref:RICIN domain-containing protein n=1 Tax=Streptomyces sp. SID13666 TaxID=2706054 RepID=UPI0034E09B34
MALGGNLYQLVNNASGKCLTPYGNSSKSGAQLTLWPCNGAEVQNWRTNSGAIGLRGYSSNQWITGANWSLENGTNVIQEDYYADASQDWTAQF